MSTSDYIALFLLAALLWGGCMVPELTAPPDTSDATDASDDADAG